MMENFPKRSIFFLLAFIWLWLLPARTMALTLEPRVGVGQISANNLKTKSSLSQIGLDIYLYEGRNLDLFMGAELTSAPHVVFSSFGTFESSVGISAATFGIHIKPATTNSFKPYLSLGGIGGKVDYEVTDLFSRSTSTDSTNFMTYRAGLGMDIGLDERLGLGMEASYTGPFPVFMGKDDDVGRSIRTSIGRLWDGNSQLVFSLGLRYSF